MSDGKLVGIVGAGRLGQAMAWTVLRAGRHVMLANSRGQRYMTLDRDLGELTKPRLDAAIEALTASL